MPTRRNILRGGLGLSILPLLARRSAAQAGAQRTIDNIWVDTQHEAGRAYSERAEKLGANIIDATQQATRGLMSQLDLEWRTTPVALAGVTSHGPMFTLEMLGRRHGMRLAYSAQLMRWSDGSVGVDVRGFDGLAQTTPVPAKSDAAWAIEMADFTLNMPVETLSKTSAQTRHQIGDKLAGSYDDPIYVWVIAPVSGAARYVAPALTS